MAGRDYKAIYSCPALAHPEQTDVPFRSRSDGNEKSWKLIGAWVTPTTDNVYWPDNFGRHSFQFWDRESNVNGVFFSLP